MDDSGAQKPNDPQGQPQYKREADAMNRSHAGYAPLDALFFSALWSIIIVHLVHDGAIPFCSCSRGPLHLTLEDETKAVTGISEFIVRSQSFFDLV